MTSIKDKAIRNISKANCPKLEHLDLGKEISMVAFNSIRPRGCQELVHLNCPLLNKLDLPGNELSTEGCKIVSKGKWKTQLAINLGLFDKI